MVLYNIVGSMGSYWICHLLTWKLYNHVNIFVVIVQQNSFCRDAVVYTHKLVFVCLPYMDLLVYSQLQVD